ncbi:MAG: hypothetical protein U0V04_19020 [Spirosomataceae bacterium]
MDRKTRPRLCKGFCRHDGSPGSHRGGIPHYLRRSAYLESDLYPVGRCRRVKADIVHVPSKKIIQYADENGFESEEGGLWGDKSHCAIFDNSKIKRLVPDYVATIPFAEGIKETLAWFEADPALMIINPRTNQLLDGLIAKWG